MSRAVPVCVRSVARCFSRGCYPHETTKCVELTYRAEVALRMATVRKELKIDPKSIMLAVPAAFRRRTLPLLFCSKMLTVCPVRAVSQASYRTQAVQISCVTAQWLKARSASSRETPLIESAHVGLGNAYIVKQSRRLAIRMDISSSIAPGTDLPIIARTKNRKGLRLDRLRLSATVFECRRIEPQWNKHIMAPRVLRFFVCPSPLFERSS